MRVGTRRWVSAPAAAQGAAASRRAGARAGRLTGRTALPSARDTPGAARAHR